MTCRRADFTEMADLVVHVLDHEPSKEVIRNAPSLEELFGLPSLDHEPEEVPTTEALGCFNCGEVGFKTIDELAKHIRTHANDLYEMPEIIIESDYDGYFEALVKGIVKKRITTGEPFKHKKIVVTAGPYQSSAVAYVIDKENETIHLKWYSALRKGFGQIVQKDLDALGALL